jgi:AAA+ ATPase superfamily predicted ATPase
MELIGRQREIEILNFSIQTNQSELVCIYGRRRVGKTFLIRNYFGTNIRYEISGLHQGSLDEQLTNFAQTLIKASGQFVAKPGSWLEAFFLLEQWLNSSKQKNKQVLFFDEFPWMATAKSGFLAAFENFWNTYISKQNKFIVVICGSAASFMINKIIKNKGGLHNRVTRKIRLLPFNLYETEKFLAHKKIKWSRYDITMCYLAMGGIPHYLNQLQRGESVSQAIDRLLFDPGGGLIDEFNELFGSLFLHDHLHKQVVSLLAKKNKGLTRNGILSSVSVKTGGTFSTILDELIESGFIEKLDPFDKKSKDSLYRLSDEYCLFYHQFIAPNIKAGKGSWIRLSATSPWKVWSGYAFESLCLKHISQIKKALGIDKIYSTHSSWLGSSPLGKAQMDLIINRDDQVINVCEMKFYNSLFAMDKKYAEALRRKLAIFSQNTGTKKNLFLTLVTAFGATENKYFYELVQNQIILDDLFIE